MFHLLGYNDMSSDNDSGDDWEENGEDHHILCLFCMETINGFPSALHHIQTSHKFDLCNFIRKYIHDTYSYIKLINFVRREKITSKQLSVGAMISVEAWDKDEYLRPVVEDDPWLMYGKYKEFGANSFVNDITQITHRLAKYYFNADIEDLINIKDVSEEREAKQIRQSDNSTILSEAQYEDMKRTIRSLKSQLKDSETTCFLVKQVYNY